jgi:hypothetical protein
LPLALRRDGAAEKAATPAVREEVRKFRRVWVVIREQ